MISRLLAGAAVAAGKPLRLRVQLKGFDVVAKMIQAGLGIGVLPEGCRAFLRAADGIAARPLTDPWATRRMWVCVRDYATLPASARQLVDHLVAHAPP